MMQEYVYSRGAMRCDFCYGEHSDQICMSGDKLNEKQQSGVICFGCLSDLVQKVYEGKIESGDADSPTVCGVCDATSDDGFLHIWCRETSGICTNCVISFIEGMLLFSRKFGPVEF